MEALVDYHKGERQQEAEYIPEFDEQELEVWERLIQKSLSKGHKVTVTYLDRSKKGVITGVAVEAGNAVLRIRNSDTGKVKSITLDKTFSVEEG